jgi:molybdopterin biosynthesis enzyme
MVANPFILAALSMNPFNSLSGIPNSSNMGYMPQRLPPLQPMMQQPQQPNPYQPQLQQQ